MNIYIYAKDLAGVLAEQRPNVLSRRLASATFLINLFEIIYLIKTLIKNKSHKLI